MTAKPGEAAKAAGKTREAHQARQARAKAAQRDLVPGTDMTPEQLAGQRQALKAETRERRPEWFA